MLMTDAQIRQAVQRGELQIVDFAEECLEPATYDMGLGKEAYTSSGRERINVEARGILIIPAGDFVIVTAYEKIKMPLVIAAHIGLRSYFARKGLVQLSGPQIDPGFEGLLVIGLCNLSPIDIALTL